MNFYTELADKNLIKELTKIFLLSNEEVYGNKDNKTLYKSVKNVNIDSININFNYYLEKQNEGLLNICTMRNEKGELVGHHISVLQYHNQAKNLFVAYINNVHVLKEYRKNNQSIDFINYSEDVLKKRGVKLLFWGVNPKLNTDRLLKRLGWKEDEIILTKEL